MTNPASEGIEAARVDDILRDFVIIKMDNDTMKHSTLNEMRGLMNVFMEKLAVLTALDSDSSTSGANDLHDQITSLGDRSVAMADCLRRSVLIVPK